MADFTALKTAIQTYIKQNGNEEIKGDILQEILLSMVTTLGDSAINDLVTALNDEVAARQNADGTLQQNITNEATARGNADTALGGRIDDEAIARANGDLALSNRLGSTITAENTAADQIGAEAEARAAADTALQGLIDGITDNIENGYVYAGIATPSSTPTTGKVFYLALTAGTYTNFGSTVVSQGINILKYNGSAWSLDAFIGIDDTPTPNSPKLVKSGGAFESVMANGSAFDISAHFASGGTLATYADLNAALTALNTLSASYKRGGMSIKFVQSSDNKYTQFRYMGTDTTTVATFTNTANWQCVDDLYSVIDIADNFAYNNYISELYIEGTISGVLRIQKSGNWIQVFDDETLVLQFAVASETISLTPNYAVSGYNGRIVFKKFSSFPETAISILNTKKVLDINSNPILKAVELNNEITDKTDFLFIAKNRDFNKYIEELYIDSPATAILIQKSGSYLQIFGDGNLIMQFNVASNTIASPTYTASGNSGKIIFRLFDSMPDITISAVNKSAVTLNNCPVLKMLSTMDSDVYPYLNKLYISENKELNDYIAELYIESSATVLRCQKQGQYLQIFGDNSLILQFNVASGVIANPTYKASGNNGKVAFKEFNSMPDQPLKVLNGSIVRNINACPLISGLNNVTIEENKNTVDFTGKKIAVLGDSISTYLGYIPEGSTAYYPKYEIDSVDKTYWKILSNYYGATIQNLSSAGGTVTSYGQTLDSYGLNDRVGDIDSDTDLIIISLGVNDAGHATIGDFDWDAETFDESVFSDAYIKAINTIQTNIPDAKLLLVMMAPGSARAATNDIANAIKKIADHYGAMYFDARDSYDNTNHPDAPDVHPYLASQMYHIAHNMLNAVVDGGLHIDVLGNSYNIALQQDLFLLDKAVKSTSIKGLLYALNQFASGTGTFGYSDTNGFTYTPD